MVLMKRVDFSVVFVTILGDMTDPQDEMAATETSELQQLQAQLDEAESAKLRALADLQNFQRREAENKKNWVQFGVADFLKKLLPRFLELKLGAEHSEDKDMQKAVENFFAELQKSGLEVIQPEAGTPIDPDFHEVLMAEKGTSGTVVRTLDPGWKFGDTVIAPAKVSAAQ